MSNYSLLLDNISKIYPLSILTSNNWETLKLLINTLFFGKTKPKEPFIALNNISLKVNKGDAIGIIGLNGSGKSTLLQIIAGTLQKTSGTIYSNGKIGALLELGSGFNPEFTGKENIYLNAGILGLSKDKVDQKYNEIITFSGIEEFINQPVRTYSSGMVVRLAFSVIAHVNPDILVIDEALAVGDARFQSKCFSFLEKFKEKGKTLLFVSHDINTIAHLCNSAILLHRGKIISRGLPKDVINEYSKIISGDQTTSERDDQNPKSKESVSKKSDNKNKRAELLKSNFIENSKEEFNYGGEKAEIISFELSDKNGNGKQVISSLESFAISFIVLGKEFIRNPVYAITIRDTKGQQIYGQNTLFSKTPTMDLEDGKKVKITFQLSANLGAGKYLISFGVTRFKENDELEVIHRRYDAHELEIINSDGSFGIANCSCSIKCEIANLSK